MSSHTPHRLSKDSSRSNALPLIPRGQYVHLSGYNHGQPYTLLDLYQVGFSHSCTVDEFSSRTYLGRQGGFRYTIDRLATGNRAKSYEAHSQHRVDQRGRKAEATVSDQRLELRYTSLTSLDSMASKI